VITGSLLLLSVPLLMAGIVYLIVRWMPTVAALMAAATAMMMGIAVTILPIDQPVSLWGAGEIAMGEEVTLLGRELVLEPGDRVAVAVLNFTASALFLLGWRFSPRSLLFPVGLALLSLLTGALLIRPFVYGALLIGIGAGLAVFMLQQEGAKASQGAIRYLTYTVLALPGLLATHWLLERYAMTPDETGILTAASALLAISFALLLGVAPFHSWVRSVGTDAQTLAGAFVLTVGNGAVWFMLLDFLKSYSWLSGQPQYGAVLLAAGTGLVLVGGLLAPIQPRLRQLMSYAAMVDAGAALMALQLNSSDGLIVALLSLLARPFGLALMAGGVSGLQARSGGDGELNDLIGLAWKAPWSTAAFVLGALSLAGAPIGAGFAARWALCQALAVSSPGAAIAVLLGGLGVLWGVWRALATLLRRPASPDDRPVFTLGGTEERVTACVLGAMVSVTLVVAGFPSLISSVATTLAQTYTTLVP
jgi:formate hydrogenlyase subunit 3/multisubunit Na+/H+ antiporter MnhD subunit